MTLSAEGRPTTVGELRAAGCRYRPVKEELRENLLARMRSGEPRFPGVVGYDDTGIIFEQKTVEEGGHNQPARFLPISCVGSIAKSLSGRTD